MGRRRARRAPWVAQEGDMMSQFENDETLDETTTEVVEETSEVEAVEN